MDINSLLISLCILVVALAAAAVYVGKVFFRWSITTAVIFTVVLIITMIVLKLLFIWRGDWKTQTIEYQNIHSSNRVIEYQMMNPGPGSYRQRHVDKIRILPGISWIKEVDNKNIDSENWKKVDIEVNELELK
ncbi:hypothetical protein [Hymenobacter rigui]|uniref:hypothetical protein n=1 Tax=Hymenobacter rigui TaxID=334424 RepID=UPI0011CFBE14|nr:hypothetical protein [Hymenobacter rigui]